MLTSTGHQRQGVITAGGVPEHCQHGEAGDAGVEKRSRHLSLTPVAGTLAVASTTDASGASGAVTTTYTYDAAGNPCQST